MIRTRRERCRLAGERGNAPVDLAHADQRITEKFQALVVHRPGTAVRQGLLQQIRANEGVTQGTGETTQIGVHFPLTVTA